MTSETLEALHRIRRKVVLSDEVFKAHYLHALSLTATNDADEYDDENDDNNKFIFDNGLVLMSELIAAIMYYSEFDASSSSVIWDKKGKELYYQESMLCLDILHMLFHTPTEVYLIDTWKLWLHLAKCKKGSMGSHTYSDPNYMKFVEKYYKCLRQGLSIGYNMAYASMLKEEINDEGETVKQLRTMLQQDLYKIYQFSRNNFSPNVYLICCDILDILIQFDTQFENKENLICEELILKDLISRSYTIKNNYMDFKKFIIKLVAHCSFRPKAQVFNTDIDDFIYTLNGVHVKDARFAVAKYLASLVNPKLLFYNFIELQIYQYEVPYWYEPYKEMMRFFRQYDQNRLLSVVHEDGGGGLHEDDNKMTNDKKSNASIRGNVDDVFVDNDDIMQRNEFEELEADEDMSEDLEDFEDDEDEDYDDEEDDDDDNEEDEDNSNDEAIIEEEQEENKKTTIMDDFKFTPSVLQKSSKFQMAYYDRQFQNKLFIKLLYDFKNLIRLENQNRKSLTLLCQIFDLFAFIAQDDGYKNEIWKLDGLLKGERAQMYESLKKILEENVSSKIIKYHLDSFAGEQNEEDLHMKKSFELLTGILKNDGEKRFKNSFNRNNQYDYLTNEKSIFYIHCQHSPLLQYFKNYFNYHTEKIQQLSLLMEKSKSYPKLYTSEIVISMAKLLKVLSRSVDSLKLYFVDENFAATLINLVKEDVLLFESFVHNGTVDSEVCKSEILVLEEMMGLISNIVIEFSPLKLACLDFGIITLVDKLLEVLIFNDEKLNMKNLVKNKMKQVAKLNKLTENLTINSLRILRNISFSFIFVTSSNPSPKKTLNDFDMKKILYFVNNENIDIQKQVFYFLSNLTCPKRGFNVHKLLNCFLTGNNTTNSTGSRLKCYFFQFLSNKLSKIEKSKDMNAKQMASPILQIVLNISLHEEDESKKNMILKSTDLLKCIKSILETSPSHFYNRNLQEPSIKEICLRILVALLNHTPGSKSDFPTREEISTMQNVPKTEMDEDLIFDYYSSDEDYNSDIQGVNIDQNDYKNEITGQIEHDQESLTSPQSLDDVLDANTATSLIKESSVNTTDDTTNTSATNISIGSTSRKDGSMNNYYEDDKHESLNDDDFGIDITSRLAKKVFTTRKLHDEHNHNSTVRPNKKPLMSFQERKELLLKLEFDDILKNPLFTYANEPQLLPLVNILTSQLSITPRRPRLSSSDY